MAELLRITDVLAVLPAPLLIANEVTIGPEAVLRAIVSLAG